MLAGFSSAPCYHRWCLLPARTVARDRYSFGKLDEALELPDLIAIQKESFHWFLEEGLANGEVTVVLGGQTAPELNLGANLSLERV